MTQMQGLMVLNTGAGAAAAEAAAEAAAIAAEASAVAAAAAAASIETLQGMVLSQALTDGTDQSITLQAEQDSLSAFGGGVLCLPSGTIGGSIIQDANVSIVGTSMGATILKAPAGFAGGVIQTRGFGTKTETHRVQLANLTIDGNKALAPNSLCIQWYGAGWRMQNVRAQNGGLDNIYTEYKPDVDFSLLNTLEGMADNVVTTYAGGNGWTFRGPHDTNINSLVTHSNAGYGFRNESSTLDAYNGTLGHCSEFNMFLDTNGWYVGAAVASYTGGQVAGAGGIGIEFAADIGSCSMLGILTAGWDTGAILRGSEHVLNIIAQRNDVGFEIDSLGSSFLQLSGEVGPTDTNGITITSEASPNHVTGMWYIDALATLFVGAFNAATLVMITQTGAVNAQFYNIPTVWNLPSGTEVRSRRTIASEGNIIALRNGAKQMALTEFGLRGNPGLLIANDTEVDRAGPGIIGVGKLSVSNSVAAVIPGVIARKMEVFNAAGASIGFVPLYDAIT